MSSTQIVRRVVAYFVDITLLALAVQGIQWGLFALTNGFPFEKLAQLNNGWPLYGWLFLTVSIPIWLYFIFFEHSNWQATPGKRLLGLKVTTVIGEKSGWRQLLYRTVLKLIPWEIFHLTFMLPVPIWSDPVPAFRSGFVVGFVVLLLYLLVLWQTPRQQSIHDLIVGTIVGERP